MVLTFVSVSTSQYVKLKTVQRVDIWVFDDPLFRNPNRPKMSRCTETPNVRQPMKTRLSCSCWFLTLTLLIPNLFLLEV